MIDLNHPANMASCAESLDYVPVAEFYKDQSVFITGGTGFLGKVLVEKLLRSCPDIKNIYLLMRPKKGKDVTSRLQELIDCPLFDRLRKFRNLEFKKIIPILGELSKPELGISKADQQLLIENVSVVFHSAATVKFDEALKLAVAINLLGTKRLVELCHRMVKLKVLVHVSTAYSNCDREEIKEEVYNSPYDPENIIRGIDWMDEELIERITPVLIGKRPNTYTFTKALAESMLLKQSKNLPVAIVRPSIVLSAWREPIPGWVDGWSGSTGLIAAGGKGVFRTMYCHGNKVADVIPVDMVVNMMICAAWRTSLTQTQGITVYNCCSGKRRPINWKDFVGQCYENLRKHPLTDAVWYPDAVLRNNWSHSMFDVLAKQMTLAYVLDFICWLTGKETTMVRIQSKLRKNAHSLEYFTTNQWHFKEDNVLCLLNVLHNEDRQTFNFNVEDIDWSKVIEDYALGIRQFVFKQNPSSLPKARKRLKKLYWMDRATQLAALVLLVSIGFNVFKILSHLVLRKVRSER